MAKRERLVSFSPAYDKRNPDPTKNYGIHGVELRMVLKGEKGAVQFLLYTNWQLPHVAEETDNRVIRKGADATDLQCFYHPMPADLGYHSYSPRYEGQTSMQEKCEFLDGKECFYDGSTFNAEPIYEVLLKEGDKGVWRELEKFYDELWPVSR